MTTLLLLSILAIGYACCWILRLQYRVRIVSAGRSEATRLWFTEIWHRAGYQKEALRLEVENARMRNLVKIQCQVIEARDFMLRQLWRDNAELEEKLNFQMIRTGHLAGQLCECRQYLNPTITTEEAAFLKAL